MYSLHEVDQIHGKPFTWFLAEGRSICEVATMYQKGLLDKKNIKWLGNKLLVCFINTNDYIIKSDESYYLFVEPHLHMPGNMHIKFVFDQNRYVHKLFRMPVEYIHEQTTKSLFAAESSADILEMTEEIDEDVEFGVDQVVEEYDSIELDDTIDYSHELDMSITDYLYDSVVDVEEMAIPFQTLFS